MKGFIIALAALSALAGGPDFDSAVLIISGAGSMEELDESTLEHFRSFYVHPLDLNRAARSRLLSSGLLNAFQVASLLDWRSRSGDILSYNELALIDGFNTETAEALKCFTRLQSADPPGRRKRGGWQHDIMLRGSVRTDMEEAPEAAGGLKYKLSKGDAAELYWSSRTSYGDPRFGLGTLSAAWYGRSAKLVLGHFNARFGQGLIQWSGFSLSPYGSVNSFRRSSTGFSPTGSFTPGCCGIAADADLGRWNFGAAYSFTDKLPIAAVSYSARRFAAGITASGRSFSADFKYGLPGISLYGEAAWNGAPAAVAGMVWMPSYGNKTGLLMRWSGGKAEFLAGASAKSLEAVAAYSREQFRALLKYAPALELGRVRVQPALRFAAKLKDGWRLEGRSETKAEIGLLAVSLRFDLVKCKAVAWLLNAEAGYAGRQFKCWLRATLFCVDNWDDRIYVYERDAPGSFNVPAYYGRGRALSLAGSWKLPRRQALYWRCSYVDYPWMTEKKDARLEVKLQYQFSL